MENKSVLECKVEALRNLTESDSFITITINEENPTQALFVLCNVTEENMVDCIVHLFSEHPGAFSLFTKVVKERLKDHFVLQEERKNATLQ